VRDVTRSRRGAQNFAQGKFRKFLVSEPVTTMSKPTFSTPDLTDKHPDLRVLDPLFRHYGGTKGFSGKIVTVKCFEDNSLVKEQAALNGDGKVLVVDGGASLRKALLGDQIATQAMKNGWAGFVINGCVRDVEILASLDLGVIALNAIPLKTEKRGIGDLNVSVQFAGQKIMPGDYIYADANGIVLSSTPLL